EGGIRDRNVTGVQTCSLPISLCRSCVDVPLPVDLPAEHALRPRMKRYVVVWFALLGIVAVGVVVTLAHPPTGLLLAGLLLLALIEAGLGLLYFMHLKYERRSFMWSVILAVVIAVVLMDHFWLDAFRLLHQRISAP